jgi:predicted acyltransferase
MSNPLPAGSRIVSMDQFRGYTVAGMMVVNFLGEFAVSHSVLKHHNTYFSYADSIMPAFHFAVGFALRLTLLKRIDKVGTRAAYTHAVRRGLALILLSTVILLGAEAPHFKSWTELQKTGLWGVLAGPLKCEFWETLTIIGVTSIWVLPVIAASARIRILFLVGCAVLHLLLCHFFYFDFMFARPNWLDSYWGAADIRGLDGGPLGWLAWSIPQILGSLAYDAVASRRSGSSSCRLLAWSIILMAAGYGLSCLSTLYPVTEPPADREEAIQVAESPVMPPRPDVAGKDLQAFLAEPPFVQPAPDQQRQMNYWLMCKRVVTLPFSLFSSGFAMAVYALFVLLSDLAGLRLGVFRTFGTNALAAYIVHGVVGRAVGWFAPEDSPWWWSLSAFALFFGITYLFIRSLEKSGIHLRM